MIVLDIPGFKELRLLNLVLDYNGTLAVDGHLLPGVAPRLKVLSRSLHLHLLTADTFGTVGSQVAHLPVALTVIPRDREAEAKAHFVRGLGGENTAAVGNGNNDRLMLAAAALGLAVVQEEGLAVAALTAADVVLPGILAALDLFLFTSRLTATLRT